MTDYNSAMQTPTLIWGGIIAVGAAFEAYTLGTKRQEDTLSETTRRTFRTRTHRAGRIAFTVGWTGFAAWYLGHVLDWWW